MPTQADTIRRNLPYLRRYARALCGEQRAGDMAVRTALQAILSQPASEHALERRYLYRALHDVAALPQPASAIAAESSGIVAARLDTLTPRHRQALLLTMLEGFSALDGAYVMRMEDVGAFADLLAAAKRALSEQAPTPILIIEDEPVIALDIASIVQQSGHEVVGIAATHAEAVALAESERPGLVLADIQLADDSSGIEAVQEILASHAVPVVFVTAYPDRLLTGDRTEPTFIIRKPFEAEMLSVAISQALSTRPPTTVRAA